MLNQKNRKKLLFFFCLSAFSTLFSLQDDSLSLKPWMLDFQKNLPKLPIDTLSNAEPEKAIITHLVWDVEPDFTKKELSAVATYTYENKEEENSKLLLDISNLAIEQIKVNGLPSSFTIIKSYFAKKPDALSIEIPQKKGLGTVEITYHTTKDSTSVFWIDKEYTEGKEFPLVYTLFQENEGASAIPGQHSPQIRVTYEINVKTKSPDLMALSSVSNNPRKRSLDGTYTGLKIDRAVPLYLLSLQVGNFSFHSYEKDPRTGVYAEDIMLNHVAQSLELLPDFMKSAEETCGDYKWGSYTPVLLSWAFPYMAMEHPCASTCGAITLERPCVIPHELAHSWAGNDITNATWQQFFWNEGLTTYLEYQICAKIWGDDYASMDLIYTIEEMKGAIEEYRETRPDLLRLCQEGDDREFTRIPYGKGALFFFMLEEALGKKAFSVFLKDYMQVFFQNSMSDQRFLAFLENWLKQESSLESETFRKIHQIDEWLYGLEIPSNAPLFKSSFVEEFAKEERKLLNGEPLDCQKIKTWDVAVTVNFLGGLIGKVSSKELFQLDQELFLTQSKIMSIREEWSRLCASASYFTPEIAQMIVDYLIERNSAHKANQISALLAKTAEGREIITSLLNQEKGRLFPLVKGKVIHNLEANF